jgi:hyaluronoglucosaminidase
MRFLFLLLCLAGVSAIFGQNLPTVYPVPQLLDSGGGLVEFPSGKVRVKATKGVDNLIVDELKLLLEGRKVSVTAAIAKGKNMQRYGSAISMPEAYNLKIDAKGIVMAGTDDAGLFYALQTLKQLVVRTDGVIKLPEVIITDWPDVRFRGTVEGFYGKPWAHQERLSQLRFYGTNKLNTYIYGPKDDPFHGFSNRWREPYPADAAAKIIELTKEAARNRVNFIWAIHPGRDISWKDNNGDGIIDDFMACRVKFEMMYDLGVRSFAVFFDDIGGEGANALKQTEMLNYLNREFVRKKSDVTPLIMCPTQYNKAWSGGDYLDILGEKLDGDISIMWTGNSVCADITSEGMDWINNKIKREAFIWWNWPVSDYVRTRLLIGRTYGLDTANKGKMSGFVSNPMDKPEASKIGLFGVANYTWNMDGFDSEKTWRDGIKRQFPTLAQPMQVFASHNSDQGPNGHGYRREESVDAVKLLASVADKLKQQQPVAKDELNQLKQLFESITASGEILVERLPSENGVMFEETEFWLHSFVALGKAGTELTRLIDREEMPANEKIGLVNEVLCFFRQMDDFSNRQVAKGAPDPWASGCVAAGSIVNPFVKNGLGNLFGAIYTSITGKQGGANIDVSSFYKMISNHPAMGNIQVVRKGKYVNISPMLEVVSLGEGEFFGIELPIGIYANYVHARLDNKEASSRGLVELSKDGISWMPAQVSKNGQELHGALDVNDQIRFARFSNVSKDRLDVKINMFKLDVPEESRINSEEALYDGDINSVYKVNKGSVHVIGAPGGAGARNVFVVGQTDQVTVVMANGQRIKYGSFVAGNDVIASIEMDASSADVVLNEVIWK